LLDILPSLVGKMTVFRATIGEADFTMIAISEEKVIDYDTTARSRPSLAKMTVFAQPLAKQILP